MSGDNKYRADDDKRDMEDPCVSKDNTAEVDVTYHIAERPPRERG